MKITIKVDVESEYINDEELKDNIYDILSELLSEGKDKVGVTIRINEIKI